MKNSKLVKITSAVLVAAIAGGTFLSYFRVPAGAATSLNNIENILAEKQANGSAFKIVEIAPDAGYGTMGYYVEGQEPGIFRDWQSTVANMDDASERDYYVDNRVMAPLERAGLLSQTADTPLTKLSSPSNGYEEHYPWETSFYTNQYYNPENASKLILRDADKFTVTGTPVPYTAEDAENGVSKQGYCFDLAHEYALVTTENVFSLSDWYNTGASSWNNEDEFHQMSNGGGFAYTPASGDTPEGLKIEKTGNSDTSLIKIHQSDSDYHIDLNANGFYTIRYKAELSPEKKSGSGDEYYDLSPVVRVFFKNRNGAYVPTADNTYTETSDGWHSVSFIATQDTTSEGNDIANDKFAVMLQFGISGRGSVNFSSVQINVDSNATHIQDIQKFVYGDAPDTFEDNLFSSSDWYENPVSKVLVHATANDKLSYNSDERQITVESDSVGFGTGASHDLYTDYSDGAYFMNADPGATYEVSFDVEITKPSGSGGNAQVHVFPMGEGFRNSTTVAAGNNAGSQFSGKYVGATSVNNTMRFTVDDATHYLRIRFGVTAPDMKAVYSNVRVRKLSDVKSYYYDVEPTGKYYYFHSGNALYPTDGTPLYTLNGDTYEYAGTYAPYERDGFHMNTGINYYSLDVKPGSFPSETEDENHRYYAVSNGFIPAGDRPAFFSEHNGELTYVGMDENGNGQGTYKIDLSGTEQLKVVIKTIFYIGGYKNNNWFKYYVLDATRKKTLDGVEMDYYNFPITVDVIEPGNPNVNLMIETADLVVLSTGMDITKFPSQAGQAVNVSAIRPAFKSDFPDGTALETLTKRQKDKDPIMVDSAILSMGLSSRPNLKAAVEYLTTDRTVEGGVNGSIYTFHTSRISSSYAPAYTIANKNFCTEPGTINIRYTTNSSGQSVPDPDDPYYRVYKEILDEKNSRGATTQPFVANDKVNEATCIRYILNFKFQRIYKSLDKIIVLDIEPCTSTPSLTLEKLNDMMPTGNPYAASDVEIVGMSVSEFVAKNEDFAESYDMIYIGASTDNMAKVLQENDTFIYDYERDDEGEYNMEKPKYAHMVNGKLDDWYLDLVDAGQAPLLEVGDPVYNDPRMNGMYYTNVGDIITTGQKTAINNEKLKKWTYWINPLNWGKMADDLTNPPALGGMLAEDYFNLGDELRKSTSISISGLNTVYIPLGGHANMRASGNDINKAAAQRLMDYAATGRPLVIDDKLANKGLHGYLTAYCRAENLTPNDSLGGYDCVFHCEVINADIAASDYGNIDTELAKSDRGIYKGKVVNDDPNVFFQYQWWFNEEDQAHPGTYKGWKKIDGATEKNYTAHITTSNMQPMTDSSGNILYQEKTRTKKILWWTKTEKYKVPRYQAVAKNIGLYKCEVEKFSYMGFTAKNKETNQVRVKMGATDYFAARLFANVYFDGKIAGGKFKNATYWVEFHAVDPNELGVDTSSNQSPPEVTMGYNAGENITDYIQRKYQVKYEYWDEAHDYKLLCQKHNQAHGNLRTIKRVLTNASDYTGFKDEYYGTGPFTAKCTEKRNLVGACKKTFSWDGNTSSDYVAYNDDKTTSPVIDTWNHKKLEAAPKVTITYSKNDYYDNPNAAKLEKAGVLTKQSWNRAILRMRFMINGTSEGVVLSSCKPGGPLSTVLVSRCTGHETDDEKHWDYDSYHFGELYGSYHYIDGNSTPTNRYEIDKNGNKNAGDGTNCPEYIYQVADVDKTPVRTDPVKWRVDTDSEASCTNIDTCSYMWRFIVNAYYSSEGVFCYDDAVNLDRTADSSKLYGALNTPRPEITLTAGSAPEYTENNPQSIGYSTQLDTNGKPFVELKLNFKISETSGLFDGSKWYAYVYYDKDGDGKFEENEKVTESGTGPISLNENASVTALLPNDTKGLIPWKLYIEEEGTLDTSGDLPVRLTSDNRIAQHMSRTGFAYMKPGEAIAINAVMVLPGAWNPAEWVEHKDDSRPYSYMRIASGKYNTQYEDNDSFDDVSYDSDSNESGVIGKTIKIYGQKKKVEHNYWSENEYIGTVFSGKAFDYLVNHSNLRRMEIDEFAEEGIEINPSTWDNKGGVGKTDGYYHLGFTYSTDGGDDGGEDIKIMITCVSIHQLNQFYGLQAGEGYGGKKWKCPNPDCSKYNTEMVGMYCTKCLVPKTDGDLLSQFNMLILGFGDSWGKLAATFLDVLGNQVEYQEGLSNYSALALRNFIKTDKAVLFCHDTTNKSVDFLDLFIDKLKSAAANIWSAIGSGVNAVLDFIYGIFGVGDDAWHMDTVDEKLKNTKIKEGYWNNIVLRESLGLDRYGITQAITTRAEAIVNGEVPGENYVNVNKDPYLNEPLGRAHMYNYIYNGKSTVDTNAEFKARDLTIKHMIETDHSVAWVPGTAEVWERQPNQTEKYIVVDGVKRYINEPKTDENGIINAEYDRYTQGFTDYAIARYFDPNNNIQQFPTAATERWPRSQLKDDDKYQALFKTRYVTQVNGGKVTSFPYIVNFEDSDGHQDGFLHYAEDMNRMQKIGLTHEQVYQCNMNGDDITVWFALAGGDFWSRRTDGTYKGIRNDAANAYYLFSRGNVTYTGAGHLNKFTVWEAKLFFNILVNAYRQTVVAPSLTFRDRDDTRENRYLLLIPETPESGGGEDELVPEENIYFRIQDANTGTAQYKPKDTIEIYYLDEDNKEVAITEFEIRDNKGTVSNSDIPKQTHLKFEVPEEVIEMFEDDPELMSKKLYARPTSHVLVDGRVTPVVGVESSIEIRRLELSELG